MHSYRELPAGYGEHLCIDMQKDKRLALRINGIAAAIMVVMLVVGHFLVVPVWTLISAEPDTTVTLTLTKPLVMLGGMIVYIVLHELTHAAVMKFYGAKQVRFGFTGLYAFAGSERDYFDRHAYVPISLAPLVLWGIVFTVLMIVLPREWFWVAYFWQISNFSGAAGDIYVSILTARMPLGVLVQDTGVGMTFYCPKD